MERNVDISEISDGRLYSYNDMVKVGCNDCKGCWSCCKGMDGLITLDPYDIYRLSSKTGGFQELMQGHVELIVDKALIVPTLAMNKADGNCTFLDSDGRCSIHDVRPGICRLFPMGRIYEDGSFSYFLQVNECPASNKSKVKLKQWIDTPDLKKYEQYINDWHYFIKDLQKDLAEADDAERQRVNMTMLQMFYISPFGEEFYSEFYDRLAAFRQT